MIDYDDEFEEMAVFCDEEGCDNETAIHGTWTDCMYELRALAWKIRERDGEYFHSCWRHGDNALDESLE